MYYENKIGTNGLFLLWFFHQLLVFHTTLRLDLGWLNKSSIEGLNFINLVWSKILFERTHSIFKNFTANFIHSLPELIAKSSCRFIFDGRISTVACYTTVSIVKMHAFAFRYRFLFGIDWSSVHKVHSNFESISGFQNVFRSIVLIICYSFFPIYVHLGVQKIIRWKDSFGIFSSLFEIRTTYVNSLEPMHSLVQIFWKRTRW